MKSKLSIILLLVFYTLALAKGDLKVLQSTSSSLLVEYNPVIVDSAIVKTSSGNLIDLNISSGRIDYIDNLGNPKLPYRLINIGVPAEFGNTIQVIATEYEYLEYAPVPVSKSPTVEAAVDYSGYKNIDEPVTFGSYGISRDLGVQTIKLSPVFYDSESNRTKFYTKIIFRVTFGSKGNANKKITESYAAGSVLNFDVASNWGIAEKSLRKASSSSVLATGTWYRFVTPTEGIYRINRSELSSLGIDAASVDPRTIKIYNNGGTNLPDKPEADAPTDLLENSITVVGESDGSFDANDYILFYGRGIDFWEYDETSRKIVRRHNSYTQSNYYWITSGGEQGKRIVSTPVASSVNAVSQTSSDAFVFVEDDLINIGKSGRIYWGDEISSSNSTLSYVNSLNGIISSEPIGYKLHICNASESNFTLALYENDTRLFSRLLSGYTQDYYWGREFNLTAEYTGSLPDDRSVCQLSLSSSSSDAKGYLDYLEISYRKELKAFEDKLFFFADTSSNSIQMRLFNFSNSDIAVFDITDFQNVTQLEPGSISGGEANIIVDANSDLKRRYLAITGDQTNSISGIEAVKNSDVHGISPGAEYVIITHSKFAAQAERLRDYRANESSNKMTSVVVYIDDIINEFSNGSNDPVGIRNFIRYAYQNWENRPFYIFLLGDGTYDYLDIEGVGNNFIPTYQTIESLKEQNSYPYDDFYCRIIGNDDVADISIGRINVQSESDAKSYIDKLIEYEKGTSKGIWNTTVTIIADDGITTENPYEGSVHTSQAERLATEKIPGYFNKNKIYLSNYPTVITGLGRRKPAVNQAIIDAVNNGTLLLNYTGHGNPEVWAHENVFERSTSLPQFNNDKYFFLTAATCDFGKYDNPNSISSTEEMLLMEGRGAIGVFSAVRIVISSSNDAINREFYTNLMNDDLDPTIGYAYYLVKQIRSGANDEKFHLFCDPALRLNIPSVPVAVDEINNQNSTQIVQIKALSEASIKGSVLDSDGNKNSSFNGEGIITVFDSEREVHLDDINYDVTEQGGIIFRGRVSVENGEYETSFRVPKDISYENKQGKIVAYIFNDNTDGIGFTDNIKVGGTDTSAVDDGTGPQVEIYFDDLSNAGASLVNPDFNLYVKLSDETGLNTTGTGVGHKLEGIIDDDQDNTIDFSNYFIGDLNSGGKSGVIDYKISEAEPGEHKIKIKAWDVFNNPTAVEKYYTVVSSEDLAVRDIYNYPNPMQDATTFTFQHNLSNMVDVKIKVYTIAGRLIKEIESNSIVDKFVRIPWDGRDNDGDQLANGTYLYKLIVKSTGGEYKKSVLGKLAVFH